VTVKLSLISFFLFCLTITTGCGSDDSTSSPAVTVTLTGLWQGEIEETAGSTASTLPVFILFYDDVVYVLREDEAQVGTFTIETNELSTWDMDLHPYANPDTDNQFYVGTDDNTNLTLSALLATPTRMVVNYFDSNRAGRIDVTLDAEQVNPLTLASLVGDWESSSSSMVINDDGGFSGWNADTSCQWEGILLPLSPGFLQLNIQRENCTEFNIGAPSFATGLVFRDGNESLHFLTQDAADVLWMQFAKVTTAVETPTTTETTTE